MVWTSSGILARGVANARGSNGFSIPFESPYSTTDSASLQGLTSVYITPETSS